ncbi:S41 family peptidase [Sphingomonas sp.]|jgi:hypothetical protein|uniref:S41 family peptidase n=1 Tax=Sphingomonas sp. TaxID=28214 RepID=UPI002DF73007|nr:S41 family peptidase [Sphingomonas sp.]
MVFLAVLAAAASCPAQTEVLQEVARQIERDYVIAAEARPLAEDVRSWARQGRFAANCGDLRIFASRLEEELKRRDQHFNIIVPDGAGTDNSGYEDWRREAHDANAGVRQVAVFENNIGYLRLSEFFSWDLARPKIATALSLLADSRALILDLRQNGGGDGETADNVLAALVPEGSTLLGWMESRAGRRENRTLPATALPRWPADRPVAVLVDRRSGSASEAVAFHLQSLGRAVIVGDRTFGSAHLYGEERKLPGGLRMTVPQERPIGLRTSASWERIGVRPTVAGGDDPLYVARRHLEGLLGATRK